MEVRSTKNVSESIVTPQNPKSKPRGAQVYGIPYSKELADFIDETSPQIQEHLLFTMIFAGRIPDQDVLFSHFLGDKE